jgi:hypothetical protein
LFFDLAYSLDISDWGDHSQISLSDGEEIGGVGLDLSVLQIAWLFSAR